MGLVLIVEDDDLMREVLRVTLGGLDCEIMEARKGKEGLELAALHQPDLVILDVILPDMDGLKVCRLLRKDERTRGAYIIMLTAKEEDEARGLEAGADEYWVKPFSPTALLRRVEEVLSNRKTKG